MRLLLASDSFDPDIGGVQRVVHDLAHSLSQAGHAVLVVAPLLPSTPEREEIDGIQVLRVRLGRPALRPRAVVGFARRFGAARQLVDELIAEFRPELAHLHFLQSPLAYLLPAACRTAGIPLLATAHGRDVGGTMVDADPVGRWAVRRVLDTAAVVTAPSQATLDIARALAPRPVRARYQVVSNALPTDMEGQLDVDGGSARAGLVAVGELHEKKGFDVLVRAVARLPEVTLRIAGEGQERAALTALIDDLRVADRVSLVGFVERAALPAFLRSAAAQVVSSRREPFGLVLLEAMACGTPVIATRVGGIPDVVGEAGVLVASDEHVALADSIARVLGDAAELVELARRGRERAREFTSENTAQAYLQLYESVTL